MVVALLPLQIRADIVPQTDDPTNSDTYQGWVDNTDGHLTADDISGTAWKGTTLPAERFIYINEANFPDPFFRSFFLAPGTFGIAMDSFFANAYSLVIFAECDQRTTYNVGLSDKAADGVFTQAELDGTPNLAIHAELNSDVTAINSLVGLEYFTAIASLLIDQCSITTLDLSAQTALKRLNIEDIPSLTQISGLDAMPNLCTIVVENTSITVLDITANTKLKWLNCSGNQISRLDVGNCPDLVTLNCGDNRITTLDVSNNLKLKALLCQNNCLTELDLSNNTALSTKRINYGVKDNWGIYSQAQYWDIQFDGQQHQLKAEAARLPVVIDGVMQRDAQGNPVMQYLYYFRLPHEGVVAHEKSLVERITESNIAAGNNTVSKFDYAKSSNWTGAQFFSGTRNELMRRAGTPDNISTADVIGDILILTPTTEDQSTGVASGTATYTYEVNYAGTIYNNASAPTGTFTLNWTTDEDVVTAITDIQAAAPAPVQVTYYDLTGRPSHLPHAGVNIVVKRYSDGTLTTTKQLR